MTNPSAILASVMLLKRLQDEGKEETLAAGMKMYWRLLAREVCKLELPPHAVIAFAAVDAYLDYGGDLSKGLAFAKAIVERRDKAHCLEVFAASERVAEVGYKLMLAPPEQAADQILAMLKECIK